MQPGCEEALPLLYHLLREMVDHPDDVLVRQTDAGRRSVFEVYVHREDVRKVIGTRGRHVEALREVLTSVAARADRAVILDVIEPEVERPQGLIPPTPSQPAPLETPSQRVADTLLRAVRALVLLPEEAEVEETSGAQVAVLTLKTAESDVSRVIGRKGRTITALRALVHAWSGRYGMPFFLEVVEPASSRASRVRPVYRPRRR